jgi:4-amino-4-deoxy-L-arabinose transferase-like glycosyltransferase
MLAMPYFEYDLWLMTGIIFVPSLFALLLLLIPRGQENLMRIVALAGTVLTLLLSVFLLVDWYQLLDSYRHTGQDGHTLAARADQARINEAGRGHNDTDLVPTSWLAGPGLAASILITSSVLMASVYRWWC